MKVRMRAWVNVYGSAVVEADAEGEAIRKAEKVEAHEWKIEEYGARIEDIHVLTDDRDILKSRKGVEKP